MCNDWLVQPSEIDVAWMVQRSEVGVTWLLHHEFDTSWWCENFEKLIVIISGFTQNDINFVWNDNYEH